MNKIIKNTAIMLITLNMFSATAFASDTSPVYVKNAGNNIPTVYNLNNDQEKSAGKSIKDYLNKANPKGTGGLMGGIKSTIGILNYAVDITAQGVSGGIKLAANKLTNKQATTKEQIIDRVDGDGNPLVVTNVTSAPTSLSQLIAGQKSAIVQDGFYTKAIIESKYSPTKPPTLQQTLAVSSKSEKTLGTELAKSDPLMKEYLDSKGLSYKLSTDKVIINTVNNLKTEQVVAKNAQMASEQVGSDQRAEEDAMLSVYNANLALIKPVVKPDIPTTAAGLTKMDKYKTMTPTVQGYSFKLETPKLDKDAMMNDFTSGLNLEGNELMKKAVENFQGIKKP